jgi:hypothetical protein
LQSANPAGGFEGIGTAWKKVCQNYELEEKCVESVLAILRENGLTTFPLLRTKLLSPYLERARQQILVALGNTPTAQAILKDDLATLQPEKQPAEYTKEKHTAWLRGPLCERVGATNWAVLEPVLFDSNGSLKAPVFWQADPFKPKQIHYQWKCPFDGCQRQLQFALERGVPHVINFSKHLWSHLPDKSKHPDSKKRPADSSSAEVCNHFLFFFSFSFFSLLF